METLFRRKVLQVVFATGISLSFSLCCELHQVYFPKGTLALGIHMPCKTVVIGCDSRFLGVLNFWQMAGRAGRRGFDLHGKVYFWGLKIPNAIEPVLIFFLFLDVPWPKQRQLLSSPLPAIRGTFLYDPALLLQSYTLLNQSDQEVVGRGKECVFS